MATRTFFVVTRSGVYLKPADGFGDVQWTYNLSEAARLGRRDANNRAQFLNGAVERVVISTCAMGLHWEDETRLPQRVKAWVLYDGPEEVGFFTRSPEHNLYWGWNFPMPLPEFATLQEAKDAAEVAVMESWL